MLILASIMLYFALLNMLSRFRGGADWGTSPLVMVGAVGFFLCMLFSTKTQSDKRTKDFNTAESLFSQRAETNIKKIIYIYLVAYAFLILAVNSIHAPMPIGEWDDYSLPIASILTGHNFEISSADVLAHKELFPNWADYIDSYYLTGFYTQNGEELTWYFPIYSLVCIPFVMLLQILHQPTEYAFIFTNTAVLMLALVFVYRFLKVNSSKKLLMILMLSIHPIIFYIGWASAEVLIYSLLVLAMTCWYNKWFKRAALSISVAGMLNSTILSVGIIMIISYLVRLLKSRNTTTGILRFVQMNMFQIIEYGMCYTLGLIPFVYNYVNTGNFSLQIAYGFTNGTESTFSRFLSYLFDLNYGYFPYFPSLLVLAVILLAASFFVRKWSFWELILMFLLNTYMFSFMVHINCGQSGIARYNAWCSTILIFAICLYFDEIISKKYWRIATMASMCIGIVMSGCIVLRYGLYMANRTSYVQMTPIAQYALDKFPALYNPLHSTFNSRTTGVDGGYLYDTPIIYTAEDGYIRKILATSEDAEQLLNSYISCEDEKWFVNQVENLTEKESYISVPQSYRLEKCKQYKLGETILFDADHFNAGDYIVSGMSHPEEWGTWTDGNEVILKFQTESSAERLHGKIICGVFGEMQSVKVYVNGLCVYDTPATGNPIEFDFNNPGEKKLIELVIELPDAISPKELSQSEDLRKLSLAVQSIIITD